MSDVLTPEVDIDATAKVAVMKQLPEPGLRPVRAESPLHHAQLDEMAVAAAADSASAGVVLCEQKLRGHLVIRGDSKDRQFALSVTKVLGLELPGKLQSARAKDASIRWISPDEWLVVVPGDQAFAVETQLREALDGHFAIVNVSGGQTIISLSGPSARDVLMKSTPYDVHDRNFPIGKVVTTVFAKTQAVITRAGEESWEMVVRRSFADYCWLWLQDSCAEFGLAVQQDKGNKTMVFQTG